MSNEQAGRFLRDDKPLPGERVIVLCRHFRCLGYRDASDHWRSAFKGNELADVVGWLRCDWIETTLGRLHRELGAAKFLPVH